MRRPTRASAAPRPAVGHGFHADYRPSYNATAAAEAWKRCLDWFNKYLRA
jgi:carboxymethylenebutenolidase